MEVRATTQPAYIAKMTYQQMTSQHSETWTSAYATIAAEVAQQYDTIADKSCFALRFTPWLARYGHLLRVLQLDLNLSGKEWSEGESLIAGALHRASGMSSQGLQLQTYKSYPACAGRC